jgi:hypothetical protein
MAGNGTPQRPAIGNVSNPERALLPVDAPIPAEQVTEEANAIIVVPLAMLLAVMHKGGGRWTSTKVRPIHQFGRPVVVTSHAPVQRHAPHCPTSIENQRAGLKARTRGHPRGHRRSGSRWKSSSSRRMVRLDHLHFQWAHRRALRLMSRSQCSHLPAVQRGR